MKQASTTMVLLLSFLAACTQAEEPVYFADATLKAAIEEVLWVSDPTPSDMRTLTIFTAGAKGIESIVGMEHAVNLWYLNLRLNNIEDLSPLAGLTNLTNLVLHKNPITDLSPLSGLTNLVYLDLNYTTTCNLSALAGLTALQDLLLYNNAINDISPLADFHSLTRLDLRQNQLNREAYEVYIPLIRANNPGINLQCNSSSYTNSYSVTISSTTGGSVVSPGEGTFAFTVANGSSGTLRLEAKADPGYVFSAWTGTCYSTQNPTVIALDRDHVICATFASPTTEFYVDDDADDDPGPGNPDVSDPDEDGTVEHPFDSIQEAVDAAIDGVIIFVQPGTYRENITISAKDIYLMGREPNDPNGTALPVIQADESGPVVLIVNKGSNSGSMLTGLAVTGGCGQAGMIHCCDATATISHCLIAGNRPSDYGSALIQCTDCNAAFINCTITDNYMDACHAGLRVHNSAVTMTNSIFYHNTRNCPTRDSLIYAEDGTDVSITYSNIEGGWSGVGNIDAAPLFACRGQWTDAEDPLVPRDPGDSNAVWLAGDYHVLARAGRWDESTSSWLYDDVTSPCIDGGDPASGIEGEPSPNGGIVNMGVYGGTTEAGKSGDSPAAQAEEPVYFADANLKAAVEETLWISDPKPSDMLTLTCFHVTDAHISSLTGLEHALNLETLSVPCNHLNSISPISGLAHLQKLIINNNSISDLSPLAGLTRLSYLDAHDNAVIRNLCPLAGLHNLNTLILRNSKISDLSPLSGLANLQKLVLMGNLISDVSALLSLTSLSYLDLSQNPLSDDAMEVQIPQITANNPGIEIRYYGMTCTVSLSSSEGGSISDPGEGTFTYERTTMLRLLAKADSGYVFTAWTGTCFSTQNPVWIYLDRDYQVCAVFSPVGEILASAGAEDETILIPAGTYRENTTISGRSIHLVGREPSDPNGTDPHVIQADQRGSIVRIDGNGDSSCTLSGFAIENGHGQHALVDCSGGTTEASKSN